MDPINMTQLPNALSGQMTIFYKKFLGAVDYARNANLFKTLQYSNQPWNESVFMSILLFIALIIIIFVVLYLITENPYF